MLRYVPAVPLLLMAAAAISACDVDLPVAPAYQSYLAPLRGAEEVPPTTSAATGTANFSVSNDTLFYRVDVSGLTARATGAHIHVGARGANGPIVFDLRADTLIRTGKVASGKVSLAGQVGQIPGDSLRRLLDNGNAYVNVHTSTFPGGEIRGQVARQ